MGDIEFNHAAAPLCLVGSIAIQILEKLNIFVCSHISSLYNIIDTPNMSEPFIDSFFIVF